jgi:hypothetical protein
LNRLINDVQWEEYKIDKNHLSILLNDMTTKFSNGYAFVVAEAMPGIKIDRDGFSIVFANDKA